MTGEEKNSPLDLIRLKERELAQSLREARDQADRELSAARKRAAEIRERADTTGQREAEEYFQEELIRVKEKAAKIEAQGNERAEQVRALGARLEEHAVQMILQHIIAE